MSAVVVLSTVPEMGTGKKIAKALIDERLAACVNLVPYVKSFYVWEGKTVEDDEGLLIIKTDKESLEKVIKRVKELHPYTLPEVISIDISGGLPEYLKWIVESVRK
ncbi:MAG: periplasmic divalent cation tolerance protein [Candidatus Aramenus sulfurataquae]|jgi:periplasmic divalent cation tolerance protein|uniref:Cation tolerance protein CutA n=2 Tax=Candidatus Aramenus sulfurataquae TaxID=1326980 RepID=W7KLI9_9CREN|nr:MAG: periplasmic divalent cation tolerance protein [Candidatus Aramenus sulfurataquae]MCL7344088.1 divalent-cation tolerance protein CutA [Candidatus Aramenus sulfurataquae]